MECGCWELRWKLVKETTSWTDGRDSSRTHGPGRGQVGKLLGEEGRLDVGLPESWLAGRHSRKCESWRQRSGSESAAW